MRFPFLVFPIAFALLFASLAQAQPGFRTGKITMPDNSIVQGYLKIEGTQDDYREIRFRQDNQPLIKTYKPYEILGYETVQSEIRFLSREIYLEDSILTSVFLKVLHKGQNSLFSYLDKAEVQHFFNENNAGRIVELRKEVTKFEQDDVLYQKTKRPYLGVLRYAFWECEELREEVAKVPFEEAALLDIFTRYSDCMAVGQGK